MNRRTLLGQVAALAGATLGGNCREPLTVSVLARHVRRIGFLSANALAYIDGDRIPFLERLRDLGQIEGRDFEVVYRVSDGAQDLLRGMAAELVAMPVDVIVSVGGPANYAAIDATSTIPIVLVVGPDPVAEGFVANAARPGGNVTGVNMVPLPQNGKKLELLREIVPDIRRVAVIYRSDNTSIDSARAAERAASSLGLDTEIFGAANMKDLELVLGQIAAGRFEGIMTTSLRAVTRDDPSRIPEFGARSRLPQVYGDVELVRAGGLTHYGPNFPAMFRDGAVLVDKILRGASPADLPVADATVFDLTLNLTAARRIGLAFPDSLLRRATEIFP